MPAPTSTRATEIKEEAAGLFAKAKKFYDEHKDAAGDLNTEDLKSFDALMEEAQTKDAEYVRVGGLEGKVEGLKERLGFYHERATGSPLPWSGVSVVERTKSWGEQFVESEEYKELNGSGVLNEGSKQSFRTGVEVKAATDLIRAGSATSGGALITPQYLPGLLPLPQRPLTVRDLFAQGQATSDTISYARQTAFDNGATPVAEATAASGASGTKPQSSIGWTRQTGTVETIATWMAATRRQLSDAGQTRSLIDNQIELMLRLEEEDQLLTGNGTSPNIRGLLNITGLQTLDLTAATGDRANLDGMRTAKRLVRTGAARAQADGVLVNPVDSEEFDLMVDAEERYRAGDPFGAGPDSPPIWRMRRVESEAITAGTAVVGAFRQGATVFEREGVQIFTSDSHADFFVRNLVAVLAEERLGLAVFFPAAFVVVTLKAWA